MLTESKINSNYLAYVKRLEKYNCYSEQMMDDMGDAIKRCSYGMKDDSGCSYDGAMIDVVLNTLCKLAYHINEIGFGSGDKNEHPFLKVNFDMLMRVLLLQHIGKAEMYVAETEVWRKKKGFNYNFNDALPSNLKLGERSLCICQKYGIKLTEEEYEAIRIIDKVEDGKTDLYSSPLAVLVKFVNSLGELELKRKYKSENNKKNDTEE